MKSIYIVTAGSYSEYRIVAVFDTLEEARICKTKECADQIEQWGLNDGGLIDLHDYPVRETEIVPCTEEDLNEMKQIIDKRAKNG